MNSIRFHDAKLFSVALTVLEMTSTPAYECDSVALTIESDEINTIADILNANDIRSSSFDIEEVDENDRRDDEHDQFRHDGEADADALASAGFGTNEDYGDFGGNED